MQDGWAAQRSRHGGIDQVPLPRPGGRLWLCGKHAVGPDPDGALGSVGASTVVCLTERHELEDRYPDYVTWLLAHHPRRAVWFPIHDLHAPSLDATLPLLADLGNRLGRGEHLLMHCGAGIGRAGTMAVCLLIDMGVPRDDALDLVARHRPMAGPEVGAQRELIDALIAARGDALR